MRLQQNITPCLSFTNQAGEAAEFYQSVFRDVTIDRVLNGTDPDGNPALMSISMTLGGSSVFLLNTYQKWPFTEAVSLMVLCEDQNETDHLWDALSGNGGQAIHCGWLKDRFGVCWQIVPKDVFEMIHDPDDGKIARMMQCLVHMKKLDAAKLRSAFEGKA